MENGNHSSKGSRASSYSALSASSRDFWTELGLARLPGWGRQFGQGMIWGGGMMLILFGLLWSAGGLRIQGWRVHEHLTPLGIIGAAILAGGRFLLFSGLEEVVWRGFVLQELQRRMALFWALGLSSLGFSLFHLWNQGFQMLGLINLVLFGLWFALLFLRTGTLWLAWGAHFSYNLWESLICSLRVSGKEGFHLLQVELLNRSLLTGGDFGPEGSWVCTIVLGLACVLTAPRGRRGPSPEGNEEEHPG